MSDMDLFLTNTAFPIMVTAFLLIRVEKKLDDLNRTLLAMMKKIFEKR